MKSVIGVRRIAQMLPAVLLLGMVACGGGASGQAIDAFGAAGAVGAQWQVPDLGAVQPQVVPSVLSDDWVHGPFMQIHVRAYKDSNGDGQGDLNGLMAQLDYLQELGIKGLWLLPVTQSEDRDHGYVVKNYRAIENDYGHLADMVQLLDQAHQRGMGVIIDYVINHASSQHPLFVNAASAKRNPQRGYFVWQDAAPSGWSVWGRYPWHPSGNGHYYAPFGSGMPDFNWKNDQVRAFHHDNLRFWLNLGVDGMRFDAVGNLVENGPAAWEGQAENHVILSQVRQVLGSYDKRFMVCEAPGAPQAFGATTSCGGAFAFDLKDHILGAARGDVAAIEAVSRYFRTAPAGMATFLANHDRFAGERVWNQLAGDLAQYRLAAATYLLLPGTPFIYYGEEIGMANGTGLTGDGALRTPMSWTGQAAGFTSGTPFRAMSANVATHNVQSQRGVDGSLHSFYKAMIGLRHRLPSLAQGDYHAAFAQNTVMGFQRRLDAQRTLVLYNYGQAAQTVDVSELGAASHWVAEYPSAPGFAADALGTARLQLPAQSLMVYRQQL